MFVKQKFFLIGAAIGVVLIILAFGLRRTQPDQLVSFYTPPGALKIVNPKMFLPPKDFQTSGKSVKIPILMYHYVEYNKDLKDTIRTSLSVAPHWFEKQLLELKSQGYETISLDELFTTHVKKPIILTFDDGYRDFYTDAYPLLKKYNMKATIYVISQFLNRPNYLTIDQLKELAASPLITVGGHTQHHVSLPNVSLNEAKIEIFGSKTDLEKLLGIKINQFAYPYGRFNTAVEELVKEAGFQTAVTTLPGDTQSNLFALTRIRVGNSLLVTHKLFSENGR